MCLFHIGFIQHVVFGCTVDQEREFWKIEVYSFLVIDPLTENTDTNFYNFSQEAGHALSLFTCVSKLIIAVVKMLSW